METGEKIGRYLLQKKIGRGGMAEIFKAEESLDDGTTRTVAVKRLFPKLSAEREFVGMFVNEARIASNMGHPNVVKVHDLMNYGSYYYIVMEYLEGLDLEELVSHSPPNNLALPMAEIAYVIHQVAMGLDYAHSGGSSPDSGPVVHRDISPGNILIDKRGTVKITDFGIARAMQYASFTRPGVLKGKYEYMAPEYVKGKDFDGRADLFSLGVVLYELLTGISPFQAVLPQDTWDKILKYFPPPPSRVVKKVPREVDRVVARALSKNPRQRIPSGEDFAGMMQEFFVKRGKKRVASDLGARVGSAMAGDDLVTTQMDLAQFLPPDEEVREHTQELHLDTLLDLVDPQDVPQPSFGVPGTDPRAIVVKKTIQDERPRRRVTWVVTAVVAAGLLFGAGLTWLLWPNGRVGYLTVTSDLRAEVYVDGKRMGLAPLSELPLPAGTHSVEVRRPGRSQAKSYSRVIQAGKHATVRVTWKASSPGRKPRKRRRKPARRQRKVAHKTKKKTDKRSGKKTTKKKKTTTKKKKKKSK